MLTILIWLVATLLGPLAAIAWPLLVFVLAVQP